MAAVLSCGPTAVLSPWAAGAHWGVVAGGCTLVDVSVRTCSHREVAGVRLHRRGGLRPQDVATHEGIPVIRGNAKSLREDLKNLEAWRAKK